MAILGTALTVCVALVATSPAQAGQGESAGRSSDGPSVADVAKRSGLPAAARPEPFHIVHHHSGQCLTIQNVSTADNAPAVQYTCDNSYPYNEDWYLDGYHIVNRHSGKCLTIRDVSTADNAAAVQYTCDNSYPYN